MALYTSNCTPSLDEEPRAQLEYGASSTLLDALETRIQELSASMQSLKEARAHIVQKKHILSSILHPIRRLPPEILSEIFRIRAFNEMDLERNDFPGSLDTRKAPWTLSQVCRTWRLVAVSMPDLWTQVNVSWAEAVISPQRAASLESMLSIQLKRSQDQPLSISFYSGETSEAPYGRLQGRLLSLLCLRASQWRSACLEIDAKGLGPLCRFQGPFCSLRSLKIYFLPTDDWLYKPFGDSFCVFENTLPHTITHYERHQTETWTPDLDDYFHVLSKLHKIEVCILGTYYPEFDIEFLLETYGPSYEFRFLHTLILGDTVGEVDIASAAGLNVLFDWLVLPALRVLRTPYAPNCSTQLVNCLKRSQCSLEELAITVDKDMSIYHEFPDDLTHFLEDDALQNVRALEIWGMEWKDSEEIDSRMWNVVFETLTLGRKGKAQVMPTLRCLTTNGYPGSVSTLTMRDEDVLLAMVSSRSPIGTDVLPHGVSPLLVFTFWNFGKDDMVLLENSDLERLLALSSVGLACNWYWEDLDWYRVD
ncbi:hypothetical protein PM082_014342 [Marasmius tenuissimus]|nr:hypothetical protein PM082_014342 [Marasmius tenuissimus]